MSNTFTNAEVVTIATRQRRMNVTIPVSYLITVIIATVPVVASIAPVALLGLAICRIAVVYDLAKALKCVSPNNWWIVTIIPFGSLVVLFLLSEKANTAIRGKGISVGFLGANRSQLANLAAKAGTADAMDPRGSPAAQ